MTPRQAEMCLNWLTAVGVVFLLTLVFAGSWWITHAVDKVALAHQRWLEEHCRLTRVTVMGAGGIFGGTAGVTCYECDDGSHRCY